MPTSLSDLKLRESTIYELKRYAMSKGWNDIAEIRDTELKAVRERIAELNNPEADA